MIYFFELNIIFFTNLLVKKKPMKPFSCVSYQTGAKMINLVNFYLCIDTVMIKKSAFGVLRVIQELIMMIEDIYFLIKYNTFHKPFSYKNMLFIYK